MGQRPSWRLRRTTRQAHIHPIHMVTSVRARHLLAEGAGDRLKQTLFVGHSGGHPHTHTVGRASTSPVPAGDQNLYVIMFISARRVLLQQIDRRGIRGGGYRRYRYVAMSPPSKADAQYAVHRAKASFQRATGQMLPRCGRWCLSFADTAWALGDEIACI